jgi:hypothetical protein
LTPRLDALVPCATAWAGRTALVAGPDWQTQAATAFLAHACGRPLPTSPCSFEPKVGLSLFIGFQFFESFIPLFISRNSFKIEKFIINSIKPRKIQNKFCWNPLG